ncbi:MAG: hypothetical protein IKP71_12010, partial [Candidatus Riflebacteria bacterium]|nr:hypothetical protein [Candidatus Riflebacteria bacterium]
MWFAFNSKIVDALVLYVSEGKGKTVYVTKKQELAAVTGQDNNPRPLVAIKYSTKSYDLKETATNDNPELSGLEDNDGKEIENSDEEQAEIPTSSNDDDSAAEDSKTVTALTPKEELKLESSIVKVPENTETKENKKAEIKNNAKNPLDEIKEVTIQ